MIRLTSPPSGPAWATYHPHFYGNRDNNRLYVAAARLPFSDLPGAGVFGRYARERQLTARNASCSQWQLPTWFDPDRCDKPLSFHGDRQRWTVEKDRVLLQTVGRGQEFVFDSETYPEALDWARSIVAA
ncbi:MAG: hypothetical protein ACLPSH_05850 [Vulcanimicrobiaceae bacterium]